MRDPNRIYPFCMKLAELWSNYPDLRFGQIVSSTERLLYARNEDMFYMEDDELMEAFERMLMA